MPAITPIVSDAQCAHIQDILGISAEKMSEFYNYANVLFEEKRVQDAADILFFLSVINPYVFEVWLARGACEHVLGNNDESLYAYQMAICLQPNQKEPYLKLIATLKDMGEDETVKEVRTLMQKMRINERK